MVYKLPNFMKNKIEVIMLQNDIGEKIRQLRKSKGLTQAQLAEKVDIDNKHLSRIEKGRHMPTYNIIKKLSEVLEFNIFELDKKELTEIKQPDKTYLKALNILNSAQNDIEKKYYLDVLLLARKGLKLGLSKKKK